MRPQTTYYDIQLQPGLEFRVDGDGWNVYDTHSGDTVFKTESPTLSDLAERIIGDTMLVKPDPLTKAW